MWKKYAIKVVDSMGYTVDEDHGLRQQDAVRIAKRKATEYPQYKVFVYWFRKSDGQTGYLNRDGNHAITGEAW